MEVASTTAAISVKVYFNMAMMSFAIFLSYFNIEAEVFCTFAILLGIDYITGVWKAKALGHSITSNKMKYGLISKFSLILIPLVLALAAKGLQMEAHDILLVGMNILILSETYSIIGNIYSIRTKQELPEYDAVAMIGKKIRTVLIKLQGDDDVK